MIAIYHNQCYRGQTVVFLVYVTVCDRTRHNCVAHVWRMHVFSTSGQKIPKSSFVILVSKNLPTNCSHHLRRVNVSFWGEISLHSDLPSLYSCRVWSPLLREIIRIPARAIYVQLDSLNYCTFANLSSFQGIKEAALVEDEIQTLARPLRSFRMAPPWSI